MPNPFEEVKLVEGVVGVVKTLMTDASAALFEGSMGFSKALAVGEKAGALISEHTAGWLPEISELSFKDFSSRLETAGLNENGVVNSARADNLVGQGMFHDVYNIDRVRGYLLRTEEGGTISLASTDKIREVPDVWPEKNIGQAVAQLGDAEILKQVEGVPLGLGFSRLGAPQGSETGLAMLNALRAPKAALAASMPQSAYYDLAQTFMQLPERGLKFDRANANNVLADALSGHFNIVDVEKTPGWSSSALDILRPLTGDIRWNRWFGPVDGPSPLAGSYRPIIEKTLKSCRLTGLPLFKSAEMKDLFAAAGMPKEYELLPESLPRVAA